MALKELKVQRVYKSTLTGSFVKIVGWVGKTKLAYKHVKHKKHYLGQGYFTDLFVSKKPFYSLHVVSLNRFSKVFRELKANDLGESGDE